MIYFSMAALESRRTVVTVPAVNARERLRLSPEELRRRCDPRRWDSTRPRRSSRRDGASGQQRALRAVDFAVEVPQLGYNVFATGPAGTGKRDTVEARLRVHADTRPAARDVVFLFNFDEPTKPLCATLAPGQGRRLERTMGAFVQQAGREIPHAFESESYQRRRARGRSSRSSASARRCSSRCARSRARAAWSSRSRLPGWCRSRSCTVGR